MNPKRVYAIVLRQLYLMRESVARVCPLFIWVAIDIVLWGYISRYLGSIGQNGFNYVAAFLGAVLLWDFLTRVMQGVTMAFFEDVWSRNFLNIFSAPISVAEYVAGLVCSSILTSLVGLVAMVLLAWGVFGLSYAGYGFIMLPALLTLFLFGIALGVAGCSMVLRMGPAAEWFIWPIPAMLSPFACVFYPLATLPVWMQGVSHLVPAMYVFEAMRTLSTGGHVAASSVVIGLMLSVLYVALAFWIFVRVYRHALRSGLIARYSAESIG